MQELLFPRYLGRLEDFIRGLIVNLAALVLLRKHAALETVIALLFTVVLLIIALYHVLFVTLPRCRDAVIPTRTAVLILIPYANILYGLFLLLLPRLIPVPVNQGAVYGDSIGRLLSCGLHC